MESLQPHIQLGKDLQIKYALMPATLRVWTASHLFWKT